MSFLGGGTQPGPKTAAHREGAGTPVPQPHSTPLSELLLGLPHGRPAMSSAQVPSSAEGSGQGHRVTCRNEQEGFPDWDVETPSLKGSSGGRGRRSQPGRSPHPSLLQAPCTLDMPLSAGEERLHSSSAPRGSGDHAGVWQHTGHSKVAYLTQALPKTSPGLHVKDAFAV